MKKSTSTRFIAIILILVMLCACGAQTSTAPNSPTASGNAAPASLDPSNSPSTALSAVNVATGPAGGLYLGLGGVVADKANEIAGANVFGITGGGSVTNVPMVSSGEAMIGVTLAPFLTQAAAGIGPYEGQKYENLCALVAFSPSSHLILVNEKISVSNYKELVEQKPKITFGGAAKTSPSYWIVESILNFYGSSHADMEKWGATIMLQSTNENASSWKDGKADFFNTNSLHPSSAMIDACTTRNGVYWNVPDEALSTLIEQGYVAQTIPAGEYPNQRTDYNTIAANTVFFCNAELPDEAAYFFTKAFVESQKALGETVSSDLLTYDMKKVVEGAGADIHPGAIRYFKERGWM